MELFKHNQDIFNKYEDMMLDHKNILVVQGTGLGKTNIAIKVINTYFKDKKILYVVPKDVLKDSIQNNKYWNFFNVDFICYNSLKKYNPKNYALCIFDEVHRAGAKTWIKEARKFIEYESCNVLGLTATEIRMDGINISKKLFNEGDTIYGLDIFDAIEAGILPRPDYVYTVLDLDEAISGIEREISSYNQRKKNPILDRLKIIKENKYNELKIENIIPKHTNGTKRFIIFVPKIEDCKGWEERFKNILNTNKVFSVHSKNSSLYNKLVMDYFNSYDGDDNIAILCVNMLSEGIHIDDVSQIIMIRSTKSNPLYFQMIGRVLSCTSKNETPVIYDFAENYKIGAVFEHEAFDEEDRYDTQKQKNSDIIKEKHISNYFNIVSDYIYDFNEIRKSVNKNIIWTDEMLEDLRNPDLRNIDIAKKYDISVYIVREKRRELGLKSKYKIIWTDEMLEDLRNPDLDNKFIAKKYGIDMRVVREKRKELGLKFDFSNKIIWTDEMLEDLRNPDLDNKFIAKKYGIGSSTVIKKRRELGLKYNYIYKIIWTDEIMEDLRNPDLSNNVIAEKYDINTTSVINKRKELGLKFDFSNKIVLTDEIMEDLRNPDLRNIDISKKYDISVYIVREKRKELGLKSKYKIIWTDEMLEDLRNPDLSNNVIAEKYNISLSAVRKKRKELGIKNCPNNKIIWTDEMLEDLRNPDLRYIAEKYNISLSAVKKKRNELGLISRHKIIWTDKMLEDLRNPDLSLDVIAKKYDIGHTSVGKKRRKLGISKKK